MNLCMLALCTAKLHASPVLMINQYIRGLRFRERIPKPNKSERTHPLPHKRTITQDSLLLGVLVTSTSTETKGIEALAFDDSCLLKCEQFLVSLLRLILRYFLLYNLDTKGSSVLTAWKKLLSSSMVWVPPDRSQCCLLFPSLSVYHDIHMQA